MRSLKMYVEVHIRIIFACATFLIVSDKKSFIRKNNLFLSLQ